MKNSIIRGGALLLACTFLAACPGAEEGQKSEAETATAEAQVETPSDNDTCAAFNAFAAENNLVLPAREDFTVLEKDDRGRATVISFTHQPYVFDMPEHYNVPEGVTGYNVSEVDLEYRSATRRVEGLKYPFGTSTVMTDEERQVAVHADCLFNADKDGGPLLRAGFHLP